MPFSQKQLTALLRQEGADLVGYADLSALTSDENTVGIAVAARLPREVIRSIDAGPTEAYYEAYNSLTDRLNAVVTAGADYLIRNGFHAKAQTMEAVHENADFCTEIPHKTVAVHAGLGWIGKSALFITKDYGSAVRLSSVLTNAPLRTNRPQLSSRCGRCLICARACPGKAITGKSWHEGDPREVIFSADACRKAARALAEQNIHKEITLCGKCIEVCPYTRRYLDGSDET